MKTRILFTFFLLAIAMVATAQKLELGNFNKIDIDGPYEVKITKAHTCGVWMEASADMAQVADITVEENCLKLSSKRKIYEKKRGSYLRVWIDIPDLEKIKAAGISSVEMQGKFNNRGREFEVDLDDIASIKGLELDADKCSVDLSDVSNIRIVGVFSEFELEMGGNSNADLDITTKTFKCKAGGNSGFEGVTTSAGDIEMNGTSKGRVNVSEALKVKLDGYSKLKYSGPRTLRLNSSVNASSKLEYR